MTSATLTHLEPYHLRLDLPIVKTILRRSNFSETYNCLAYSACWNNWGESTWSLSLPRLYVQLCLEGDRAAHRTEGDRRPITLTGCRGETGAAKVSLLLAISSRAKNYLIFCRNKSFLACYDFLLLMSRLGLGSPSLRSSSSATMWHNRASPASESNGRLERVFWEGGCFNRSDWQKACSASCK